jgi:hypothetical protein
MSRNGNNTPGGTKRMMTFKEASDILGKRDSKIIRNNTRLVRRDTGDISILYHNTYITTIDKKDNHYIDTKGWHTRTTKVRINDYCPISIYQYKGTWYFTTPEGSTIPYRDGFRFNKKGDCIA